MDYHFLSKTMLFRGITPQEAEGILTCLNAVTKQYPKGSTIFRAGDVIHTVGLVLSGSVSIETDDVWGNQSVLEKAGPGQVFVESYACISGEPLMIRVVAAEACEILFLDMGPTLQVCSSACSFHNRLIQNLLSISAQKNLALSRRIFHTSSKSIRGRLLSYLSFQSAQQGSPEFEIPLNRQQLADYLSVDRSALSNELGKMQRDGLIRVERNRFTLLHSEE